MNQRLPIMNSLKLTKLPKFVKQIISKQKTPNHAMRGWEFFIVCGKVKSALANLTIIF